MAHIFSDGFSLYDAMSSATLIKGWTGSDGGSSDMSFRLAGRWGADSYALYINDSGTSNAHLTQALTTSGSTTIVGFAIRAVGSNTIGTRFLSLTNGTAIVALCWAADQKIAITDGASTTYFTIPSSLATGNTWYYLELKVVWHASTGRIIFRMDTSQYYDSGATLALGSSTNATSLTLGATNGTNFDIHTYYADLLIMDSTGSTFNDFQGDVRIETLLPNGDGNHTAWALPGTTLLTSINQARFTTDTSGWSVLTGSPGFTRSATGGPKKTIPTYANLTGSAGTTSIISTPNGTSGYPVTPGQTLRVGGYSGINTGSSISIYLRFYDGTGATVGADVNAGLLSNAAGGDWRWNITSGTTVPASAATCAIILSPNSGGKFTGISLTTSSYAGYLDPSGEHHFATSEAPYDGDTSYASSNTVSAKDTYAMDPLLSTAGAVLGVRTSMIARKENASIRTIGTVTRIGGTDYAGAPVSLPDNLSFQSVSDFFPVSPATGTTWTRSEVNNLESGMDIPS